MIDTTLSNDEYAVFAQVRAAQEEEQEIDDGCARTIASWASHGGSDAAMAFVTTGAMTRGASDLWRELGGAERDGKPPWMRDALDCLGTYLLDRARQGRTDAVAGWADVWVRR